jgi:hypothetical protein
MKFEAYKSQRDIEEDELNKEGEGYIDRVEAGAEKLYQSSPEGKLVVAIGERLNTLHPNNLKQIRAWVRKNKHVKNFADNKYDVEELSVAFIHYSGVTDCDYYS